jgi:hypothetical protein
MPSDDKKWIYFTMGNWIWKVSVLLVSTYIMLDQLLAAWYIYMSSQNLPVCVLYEEN